MKFDKISLSHGGGGEEMNWLINRLIFKIFDNEILNEANDAALFGLNSTNLAFTTDSFVVTPRFFSGGDIGKIAVCGTVNDLLMVGAKPLFLSCALIIEEGFDIKELEFILLSMHQSAKDAGVKIVCGDTKVVPRGKCDGLFINTSGVGEVVCEARVANLSVGAKIILSSDIGRHGAVVLGARDELALSSELKSDCAPLNSMVFSLIENGIKPLAMRDATRGGLSGALNEWASCGGFEIGIYEDSISVCQEVRGVCELLGFEAYELANEGTFIAAVLPHEAQNAVEILGKFNPNAAIIGEIRAKNSSGIVTLTNNYGATRYLETPKGELLPRIC